MRPHSHTCAHSHVRPTPRPSADMADTSAITTASSQATTGPVTSVPLPDLQCELLGGDPASATNRNAVDSTSMTKPAVEPISGPISAVWSPPDVAAVLASSVALLLLLLLACGYRRHRRLASASFHLRVSRDRAQFDLQLLEHRFKKRKPQVVTPDLNPNPKPSPPP